MDAKLIEAARTAFPADGARITLGAPLHEGGCHAEPLVGIPLAMMNRHGLIAGATGGREKSLIGSILNSPLVRDVARQMTRSLMGAWAPPRRRTTVRRARRRSY